jgi:hypothetical protein
VSNGNSDTYVRVTRRSADVSPPTLTISDLRGFLADYDFHTSDNTSGECEDAVLVVTLYQQNVPNGAVEIATAGRQWNITSIAAETRE